VYLDSYLAGAHPEGRNFVEQLPNWQHWLDSDRVEVTKMMLLILDFLKYHSTAYPVNDYLYNLRYFVLPQVWNNPLSFPHPQGRLLKLEWDHHIHEYLQEFDKKWKHLQPQYHQFPWMRNI
jgi:hypothetical protein